MDGPQTRALAAHLNDSLTGKPVDRILVPEHRWQANVLLLNCVGQVIQRVRSHGKWLFFDFSHGISWLCQLITRSRFTVLLPDQASAFLEAHPPSERPAAARAPLITLILRNRGATPPTVATLTGRPIFYILPTDRVWKHADLAAMGPDPIGSRDFHDLFPYRLRQHPARTIAACLLDQTIVAGIGNMLKSEILFALRLPPATRVGSLLASQIDSLASTIVALAATATDHAGRGMPFPYRVADRAGLPCPNCGSDIAVDHSGQDAHLTWFCPTCQPPTPDPTLF